MSSQIFRRGSLLTIENLILFSILVLIIVFVTQFYISQEQYYYFWDYLHYFEQVNSLISTLGKSPFEAVINFIISLFDDYTQLPLVALLPFRLILGPSRLGFVLSLALAYILPFCLTMGVTAAQMMTAKPKTTFWIAAFASLLVPAVWIPIFRGFPDLGGATLLMIATLLFWKDFRLETRHQIKQIAIVLALSVLFRRHFVYEVRAFLATICIYHVVYLVSDFLKDFRTTWLHLKALLWRVGHLTVLFILFSCIVFIKALLINYRVLYASYEMPALTNFWYYGSAFGFLLWGAASLGFLRGCFEPSLNQPKLRFMALFGMLSLIQWIFFAKQISAQYTTHFAPFIVLGICLSSQMIWLRRRLLLRAIGLGIQSFFLILNTTVGLGFVQEQSTILQAILATPEPPLFRKDYETVAALVRYLRHLSTPDKPIYIAASSYTLNYSIITAAEQQRFGQAIIPMTRTSNIDSRDFYPINSLLKADYVVVATPFQYHIKPQEQKLVKSVVEMFSQHLAIAQDFNPLPTHFVLEKGVLVQIYERIRPTSLGTIFKAISLMTAQVSRKPAMESNWIDLNANKASGIEKDPLIGKVQILNLAMSNQQPASLLYYGPVQSSVKLSGILSTSKCTNPNSSIELQLSALDQSKTEISAQTKVYASSWLSPFEIKLHAPGAKFLIFKLRVNTSPETPETCRADINLLEISRF